jgi:hypothetical protein
MKFAKWILALLAITFATAAYPPSKATLSLSPPTVAPGGMVTATLCGFDPGETIVVSVAGLAVVTTVAGADGCATVSFTASFEAGAVTVTAAGQSSGQSATSILTIEASTPTATTTTTAAGSAGKSPLPTTGRSVNPTLRAAGGLVVAGVGVMIVSVRRQSDRDRQSTRRKASFSSPPSRRR